MFTPDDRDQLREMLIAAAQSDERFSAAALLGSTARGVTDRWSDIDLAFAVSSTADAEQVVADWTDRLYHEHGAVDHLDVHAYGALHRVFFSPTRCRSISHSGRRQSSAPLAQPSGSCSGTPTRWPYTHPPRQET